MCLTYLHIRCNYTYAYAWESSSKLTFNWGYEFLLVFWPQTLSSRLTKKKLQQSAPSAVLVCIMHYFTRSHTQHRALKFEIFIVKSISPNFREIDFRKIYSAKTYFYCTWSPLLLHCVKQWFLQSTLFLSQNDLMVFVH